MRLVLLQNTLLCGHIEENDMFPETRSWEHLKMWNSAANHSIFHVSIRHGCASTSIDSFPPWSHRANSALPLQPLRLLERHARSRVAAFTASHLRMNHAHAVAFSRIREYNIREISNTNIISIYHIFENVYDASNICP